MIDSGKFQWAEVSGKYPSFSEPEAAYHGLIFADLDAMAFIFHSIAIGLRDLGMTMNPQGAHYTLCGIETLSLRMERHVANAKAVASWGEGCPRRVHDVKGGYDSCVKLVNNLKLFSNVANLGDARSLVIHSASTTHRQLTEEQQIAAGAAPNVIQVSIGIEDAEDIIADLDQAMAIATL